jgi:8-oxo-dGTP pyrophosphatase MutT (NUDIX family)
MLLFMTEYVDLLNGPIDLDGEYNLAVVRSAGAIILGRKTRGYGTGKLVLPGGKEQFYLGRDGIGLVPGAYGARREVRQETGLTLDWKLFKDYGRLHILTEDDEKNVGIFLADLPGRPELTGSDELDDLAWHVQEDLPYKEMPADYRLWLPHVLTGHVVTVFMETEEDKLHGVQIYTMNEAPGSRLDHTVLS